MATKLKAVPDKLRASFTGRPATVDRKAKMLRGYVVAQLGPFKSDGRGQFDLAALKEIVRLGNESPKGLKSRFTHPDMSSDGLGKHLGRSSGFSLSQTTNFAGETIPAARADLAFDDSAFKTPSGDLATYVMDLAESDPEALSSSLVLSADQQEQLAKDGSPMKDKEGNPLPPLWMPTKLFASDIVDTGDAVDGLLSHDIQHDGLPLSQLWAGANLLDSMFIGETRDVIEARLADWAKRYLSRRFGEPMKVATPELAKRLNRLDRMALVIRERMT